ncbi:unnamed protein product [Ambrosiozyma monospora]|uniref:Unnamed protein product n=1 Tax=Ambrosiozyma monospora TaxID=43982 RepID=A0ACB5SVX1_AMBMO|nr:unnamed protein product [Ambrosiozyma monospora]
MNLISIIFGVLFYLSACSAFEVSQTWEISNYQRTLDVLKSYVKDRTTIVARNIGSEPSAEIYAVVPGDRKDLALQVSILESPQLTAPVLTSELVATENGFNYYRIDLPFPMAPKSEIRLMLSYIVINQISTLVEEDKMGAPQYLQIHTYKEPLSVYETKKYQLAIVGAKEFNELSTKKEGSPEPVPSRERDTYLFGPYEGEYKANHFDEFHFSYRHDFPLPYVYNLERNFWVSHWSDSLQLEEYYELSNKAVKLDSGFSRVDFMNSKLGHSYSSVMNSIMVPLPENVETEGVYYTDKVGNVTTSAFVHGDLLLKPRFPIFGGWHYNFTLGWEHKLSEFAHAVDGALGEYLLKVKLLDGLVDAVYENVTLSVYLPEGAKFINATAPFEWEDMVIDHEYSYLDVSSGHTKVTFYFSNLVDELRGLDIIVHYKYSVLAMLKKPFVTAFYIFLALMGLYFLRKIDVNIKPKGYAPNPASK